MAVRRNGVVCRSGGVTLRIKGRRCDDGRNETTWRKTDRRPNVFRFRLADNKRRAAALEWFKMDERRIRWRIDFGRNAIVCAFGSS